jgi:hypothetical protein
MTIRTFSGSHAEKEVGPRPVHHPRREDTDTNNTSHAKADTKQSRRYDRLAGHARRRVHATRSTPIGDCRCIRDPEADRHRCGDEITDVMAEAVVAAVEHLDQLGTPALLDHRTTQAMWRNGHRKLAVAVHHRTAGAA